MIRIGFHASHEQFPPSELLGLVQEAEAAGFDCAMSSDHFQPWGPAQGLEVIGGHCTIEACGFSFLNEPEKL